VRMSASDGVIPYVPLTHCVVCGGVSVEQYLDLGSQPLANDYPTQPVELPRAPLAVAYCHECSHSQLTVSVDPAAMFTDYLYVSGTTTTLRTYFDDFVLMVEAHQGPALRVLDIASNDGSLLKAFRARGHSVYGVDPARNLAASAEADGIPTLNEFWGADTAERVGQFDTVIAMNVLAHVPDPLGFLEGVRAALKPGGRAYLQTSQANMFANHEFDTVYHEHLSYFSVRSFLALFARAGLQPIAVTKPAVHGTSFLWTCTAVEDGPTSRDIIELLDAERSGGWHDFAAYRDFGDLALARAAWVRSTLRDQRERGRRIMGYGAAAKGNTFLNFAEIRLEAIFEDNPLKVGRYAPGTLAPILASDTLGAVDGSLCFLIPAWNFADEIIERVRRHRGTATDDVFIVYFPEGRVIES
jgi:SAM-dependent methyltransferase